MDITYSTKFGILEIHPNDALAESDFEKLAAEIGAIVKDDDRELKGLLIHTKDFPGYEKFSDLLAHGKFVGEHHDKVGKIALCTDSSVGKLLELIGRNVAGADVKKFGFGQKDKAEKWILS